MKCFLITMFVALVVSGQGHAGIIAECGPSSGHSFFFQGKFVPANKSGWDKDKISKGSTSIILVDGKFDVLYSDGASKNRSSRADGALIVPLGENSVEKSIVLLVVYKNKSAEIYTYHGLSKTLIYQPIKYNMLVNSAKIIVSRCK
jgi:hypothetical protein